MQLVVFVIIAALTKSVSFELDPLLFGISTRCVRCEEEQDSLIKNTIVVIMATNTMYVWCTLNVTYYGVLAVAERTGYQNICEYIIVCECVLE